MKDIALFFKALSDESRLAMLWLLFNRRELCVCDIMEALGITQSKASRHLTTLKHAGLVTDRREGTWSYYSLVETIGELERGALKALRASLANRPEARRLLAELSVWLERKGCSATCNPPGKRPASKRMESR